MMCGIDNSNNTCIKNATNEMLPNLEESIVFAFFQIPIFDSISYANANVFFFFPQISKEKLMATSVSAFA